MSRFMPTGFMRRWRRWSGRWEGKPWLRSYRHTGHYTLIADNGAVAIRVFVRGMKDGVMAIVGVRTELEKPGADGRTIADLE